MMKRKWYRTAAAALCGALLCTALPDVAYAESDKQTDAAQAAGDAQTAGEEQAGAVREVTLRVCNWEEYIDLGDWDEEETIDLESGDIIGVNSMVEDFEAWYLETYGIKVNV
ncbi:hypothetical protein VPJ68_27410, partial [Parabacteroides distasonis]